MGLFLPLGRRDQRIGKAGRERGKHKQALCSELSEEEPEVPTGLLGRIAEQSGLLPGVHPGFNSLGPNAAKGATGR